MVDPAFGSLAHGLSLMEREDMDESAYPTPKMDTVPTPAPEPDEEMDTVSPPAPEPDEETDTVSPPAPEPEPEPEGRASGSEQGDEDHGQKKSSSDTENRFKKLEDRVAAIELKTEGNLNVGVHGDYHKTVHGNSQTTVLGGSNQRVSGGRAVSVAGASVSTVGGSNVNVTGVAKGCISATRWVASGLDVKAVGVKRERYVSKFENGVNRNINVDGNNNEVMGRNNEVVGRNNEVVVENNMVRDEDDRIIRLQREMGVAKTAFARLVHELVTQRTHCGLTRLENLKRLDTVAEVIAFR